MVKVTGDLVGLPVAAERGRRIDLQKLATSLASPYQQKRANRSATYALIPTLDPSARPTWLKHLVDGWNITDSAGGRPAPSAAAVACVLKQVYPDKLAFPMLIMNYKGAVEIGAAALAAEAVGVDGMIPDPGDPPAYGNLIKMGEDGGTEVLTDADEILAYRRSWPLSPSRTISEIL